MSLVLLKLKLNNADYFLFITIVYVWFYLRAITAAGITDDGSGIQC